MLSSRTHTRWQVSRIILKIVNHVLGVSRCAALSNLPSAHIARRGHVLTPRSALHRLQVPQNLRKFVSCSATTGCADVRRTQLSPNLTSPNEAAASLRVLVPDPSVAAMQ